MFKVCSKCQESKSFDLFSKDAAHPTGRKSTCKKCVSDHYEANKVAVLARNKKYVKETDYAKTRRQKDPSFRIAQNLRARITRMIRRNGAGVSAIKDLGCSVDKLKSHLESLFQPGMTWENYGEWHIDHIVPLSSAKNREDLVALCFYANLQPLWAWQNQKKYNKVA